MDKTIIINDTIDYFVRRGILYGVRLGFFTGVTLAIMPVLEWIAGAVSGAVYGGLCGLVIGVIVMGLDRLAFHEDLDLDRYGRRLAWLSALLVTLSSLAISAFVIQTLVQSPDRDVREHMNWAVSATVRMLSVGTLFSALSAAYAARQYPAWRAHKLDSRLPEPPAMFAELNDTFRPLWQATQTRWVYLAGAIFLSAWHIMMVTFNLLHTYYLGEAVKGLVGVIPLSLLVTYLLSWHLSFGVAALVDFLRSLILRDLALPPRVERIIFTICAFGLSFASLSLAFELGPLVAAFFAALTYRTIVHSDFTSDKYKNKEKNALALEDHEPESLQDLADIPETQALHKH